MVTTVGVGVAVFAGCEALSMGIGSVGCAVLAGAASGAVGGALDCKSGESMGGCVAKGAAIGAVEGLVGGVAGKVIAAVGGRIAGAVISRLASRLEGAATNAGRDLAEVCAVNSFATGTLVLMADGTEKRIEDIQPGDLVMAGDPQKGIERAEPVQYVIVGHGLKHLYDIHVDGETVEATYNHPFWVVELQTFVWAQDLVPGEHLLLADGRAPPITAVSHHDEITTVYNLSIANIHTFYVGSSAVLVHNLCREAAQGALKAVTKPPTGQLHHLLSNPIVRQLAKHATLAGQFVRDDARFIYRAANQAAHRGYQTWHREMDKGMVDWLRDNQLATRRQFLDQLQSVYSRPDIAQRIPGVNLSGI